MIEQVDTAGNGKPITPYVLFVPDNKGGMQIQWAFTTFSQLTPSGKLACHIPAFDLYFSAADRDIMDKKSKAMTKLFFDHYILHNGKNRLKSITLQLHKMGFKAQNDTNTIHQLINNKTVKAKFKSLHNIPSLDFSSANHVDQELTMEVPC